MKIDSQDSEHERQAESADQSWESSNQILGSSEVSRDSITGSSTINEDEMIPSEVQDRINSAKGQGDKLPEGLKRKLNAHPSVLNEVRVHTDSVANELTASVGANAFAVGNDIYFSQGKLDTYSLDGLQLIQHELVHVAQQREHGVSIVQRQFAPENASEEMNGKKFTLNQDVAPTIPGVGAVTFPVGQEVIVKTWSNTLNTVYVYAKHNALKRPFHFSPLKSYLTPVGDSVSGLDQYHAGVTQTQSSIATGQAAIDKWKSREPEFQKANNMQGYNEELTRLKGLQDTRYKNLNAQLIQETMYNSMDASIKRWTEHYNKEIGSPAGWTALDPNLVKAMVWKETQMGTAGQYLPTDPVHTSSRMTRFNVMQAIDSSGPQQIIMMDENDLSSPSLEDRYHYNQVPDDLEEAKKLNLQKKRTPAEDAKVDELKSRCWTGSEWRYNDYFTKDPRWYGAVSEFFGQTGTRRNFTYDFWIQTGVRWLFEKRKSVNTWDAAITAYNGSGTKAAAYKDKVKSLAKQAKSATQQNSEFIPK